ncbi:MAG: T9SS type A sorting domain-containing protein, partial [Bacteroidia bacterium]
DLRGFLMKISPEGEILWSQDYPQITECGMSLYNDSKIILSGYIYPNVRPKLLLLNNEGVILQNKTYTTPQYSTVNYIGRKSNDGGIISVGITTRLDLDNNNEGSIMKADSLGNLLWYKSYRFTNGDFVEYFTDFIETSDGGILISGSAVESSANGGQNSWLIKLDANGCIDPQDCEVGVRDMPLPDAVTIYPNPAQDWLKIDIEQNGKPFTAQLIDATGRLIQNQQFSGIGTHTLNLSGLAKGVYYCRIMQGNEVVVVERVVKM